MIGAAGGGAVRGWCGHSDPVGAAVPNAGARIQIQHQVGLVFGQGKLSADLIIPTALLPAPWLDYESGIGGSNHPRRANLFNGLAEIN